jgi:hypothetical protein
MHMNRLRTIAAIILAAAPGLLETKAQDRPGMAPQSVKLWAALSVPEPIFQVGQTERLQIYFAVVNDGDTAVNPKIGSSHLFNKRGGA